ncbi:MAG: DUF4296 domain-containing protein [Bacteroidales bacterium]|jgi:hypothetical protein|nr:DUF4296 domain-containing protein [Bacteroidales bacterium]
MRFRPILALFIVLILTGCSERAQKPKPFLNEKQMVKLITEMHLTEVALRQMQDKNKHNLDSMRLYTNAAYFELFEKYGVDKESFEANLYYHTYYSRNLEKIYTQVYKNIHHLDSLNRQTEFTSAREDMSTIKSIER